MVAAVVVELIVAVAAAAAAAAKLADPYLPDRIVVEAGKSDWVCCHNNITADEKGSTRRKK